MMLQRLPGALFVTALALAGCAPQNANTLPVVSSGAPAGGATAGPLTAKPQGKVFTGLSLSSAFIILGVDPNATLTVAGCNGIVSTDGVLAFSVLTLTSTGVGTCTLRLTDAAADEVDVAITVSALTVPVN
jgi:hypothetical protein